MAHKRRGKTVLYADLPDPLMEQFEEAWRSDPRYRNKTHATEEAVRLFILQRKGLVKLKEGAENIPSA